MATTVIFDLDGTLLYTLEDLHIALNRVLSEHGYPNRTLCEVRQFVGNGVVKLIERSLPNGCLNSDFKSVLNDFYTYYERNANIKTHPYNGICKMLDTLVAKGARLAVNSNKFDSAVQSLTQTYFPQIEISIGAKDGVDKKPAPYGVYDIMKFLGSQSSHTYFVGDSDVDILTAKNAGIKSIGVTWGYRSKESLIKAGADFIIDKPRELPVLLN